MYHKLIYVTILTIDSVLTRITITINVPRLLVPVKKKLTIKKTKLLKRKHSSLVRSLIRNIKYYYGNFKNIIKIYSFRLSLFETTTKNDNIYIYVFITIVV